MLHYKLLLVLFIVVFCLLFFYIRSFGVLCLVPLYDTFVIVVVVVFVAYLPLRLADSAVVPTVSVPHHKHNTHCVYCVCMFACV